MIEFFETCVIHGEGDALNGALLILYIARRDTILFQAKRNVHTLKRTQNHSNLF